MEFSKHVMVALVPTTSHWCHIAKPHMTLVYAGKLVDSKPSAQNELAKETITIARSFDPITLDVIGADIFGGSDDEHPEVDVLLLRMTPELLKMREHVEEWNASEHDFTAHVTVGPVGTIDRFLPRSINFDQIMVGWGDYELKLPLRRLGVMTWPKESQPQQLREEKLNL